MTWKADVPFPAEDMGRCRGCDAQIGWVHSEDEATGVMKPHPVEAKGWAGDPCGREFPGAKRGRTLDGNVENVCEPPASLFQRDLTVVFESHFIHCPKADRFRSSGKR